jgi:hypothetical protein
MRRSGTAGPAPWEFKGTPQRHSVVAAAGWLWLATWLATWLAWGGTLPWAWAGEAKPPKKPTAESIIPRGPDEMSTETSPYVNPEGKARTGLFGAEGEGYRFVYVLDRSNSMGWSKQRALRAVKREVIKSLKNLDRIHQFQIVFYNEEPLIFNPSGTPGKLAFADQHGKERAARFVDAIKPDGGTEHMAALRLALRLQPDVVFFLTDGDEPKITRKQLDELQRKAAGVRICTIEFGIGPKPAGKSFLAVLAKENGGQYVYVDLLTLPKEGDSDD